MTRMCEFRYALSKYTYVRDDYEFPPALVYFLFIFLIKLDKVLYLMSIQWWNDIKFVSERFFRRSNQFCQSFWKDNFGAWSWAVTKWTAIRTRIELPIVPIVPSLHFHESFKKFVKEMDIKIYYWIFCWEWYFLHWQKRSVPIHIRILKRV